MHLASLESGHYEADMGPLIAEPGRLYSVADLVRLHMNWKSLPLRPAIAHVLDAIAAEPGLVAFITQPGDYAKPIPPAWLWRKSNRPPLSRLYPKDWQGGYGVAGLVDVLRLAWRHCNTEEGLYIPILGGQFAMLRTDAQRIFGFVDADESDEAAPEDAQPLRLVAESVPVTSPPSVAGTAPAQTPESLPDKRRRAVAMLRDLKQRGIKAARTKVAKEFKVDPTTVGEWFKIVEKEETEGKKAGAWSTQIQALTATCKGA